LPRWATRTACVLEIYRRLGLKRQSVDKAVDKAVEPAIENVWQRLSAGKGKCSPHASRGARKYRLCRRDEKGRIANTNDDLPPARAAARQRALDNDTVKKAGRSRKHRARRSEPRMVRAF
jgi:hypothetical protein